MFVEWTREKQLKGVIVSKEEFHPYPAITERRKWEQLPDNVRTLLIAEGERYLNFKWPELTASMYIEFNRSGNRTKYETPYHVRRRALTSLVLAECIENQGRFVADIINGIWCICEESSWVTPSHHHMSLKSPNVLPGEEAHFIDLFAAETANMLGWIYYLIKPSLDSLEGMVTRRIYNEVKRRVLDIYLNRNDFWWMGFDKDQKLNNWTPWCISNCLSTFLVLEENKDRRVKAVAKSLYSLERFISTYDRDGGCDEGPGYWNKAGGSMFDCLELLYICTKGEIDLYHEPLIQNIGGYIYKVHINDNYFLNFADCQPQVEVEGDLLYRFGKRIGDENLLALGSSVHKKWGAESIKKMKFLSLLRVMPAIFNYQTIKDDPRSNKVQKHVWLDGIQVMAARETLQTDKGLYLAIKGGHNNESHNHNDVGNVVVYADGHPVLVDVGVGEYTARTFGSQRYDIWTMQSGYHNVPTVNGLQQQAGSSYTAKHVIHKVDNQYAGLSMNIASAYPKEANVQDWVRNGQMIGSKDTVIQLKDQFRFKKKPNYILWNFMTCWKPELLSDQKVILRYDNNHYIEMIFSQTRIKVNYETIELEDEQLKASWGDHLYRIIVQLKNPEREGDFVVEMRKGKELGL